VALAITVTYSRVIMILECELQFKISNPSSTISSMMRIKFSKLSMTVFLLTLFLIN
jgi:hypothetical protein